MVSGECAQKMAVVLDGKAEVASRDESLYYVLCNDLRPGLEHEFEPYADRALFTFEDALQDYFLYLRGDGPELFPYFGGLRDCKCIDSWLLSTFRNFINKKVRNTVKVATGDVSCLADDGDGADIIEKRVGAVAVIIAYFCQELPRVQRFVFLRMVLSILDKDRALPQVDVARVLGMSHVYYRVLSSRVHSRVISARNQLMRGEMLPLNKKGRQMRDALKKDFHGWYELICEYYESTISEFEQADRINQLRYHYSPDREDHVLHDSCAEVELNFNIFAWNLSLWIYRNS